MNEKNTEYLYAKFPILYAQHSLSCRETAMCWGFDCGDGWFKIIQLLSKKLSVYMAKHKVEVQAVQVKEKMGYLHFYIDAENEEIDMIIHEAVQQSLKTCEECGSTDKVKRVDDGWITTLCPKCRKKRNKEFRDAKLKEGPNGK